MPIYVIAATFAWTKPPNYYEYRPNIGAKAESLETIFVTHTIEVTIIVHVVPSNKR